MNKFNGRRRNVVKERNQEKRVIKKRLGVKAKHDLSVKLVSGPVRSGKGKKKAEKAARLVAREAARASSADDTMADAPKATKGQKAAKAKAGAGSGVTAMEADN